MTETSTSSNPRPFSVTLVMVLIWIGAVVSIVGGIILIVEATDPAVLADYGGNPNVVRGIGIFGILIGVIMGFVASGIGRGSQFARFIVTLVMILRIVGDIFIVAQYGTRFVWQIVFAVLWALLILFLLWNSRASRFFTAT